MPQIFLSTDQINRTDRNDFWRSLIRPVYEISSFNDDTNAPLEGTIWSYSKGPLVIGATRFNQQRYQRDKRLIGMGGLDFYLIQLITGGDLKGDFAGTDVNASVGDIVIIDLAYSVRSAATAGRRITTTLPREALNRAVNRRTVHGTVLRAQSATTRLVAHFLKGVLKVAPHLTDEEAADTQEAMINLFSMALRNVEISTRLHDEASGNYAIKEAIIQYIDQNITSTNLGVGPILERFNISRAHLYRLFEQENGVSGLIKDKRLDLALRALSSSRDQHITSKQLAYQFGFDSPETFNRLFRNRFGIAPREMARSGQAPRISDLVGFNLHNHIRKQVLNAADLINKTTKMSEG